MVRAMLSESLQAVISQTLCKTKDGQGRVAAHEIMLGTPAIRNLIREAKVAQMYSTIQTSQNMGMQTLDQNLTDLVRRNVISAAEARSKAKIPENFLGNPLPLSGFAASLRGRQPLLRGGPCWLSLAWVAPVLTVFEE